MQLIVDGQKDYSLSSRPSTLSEVLLVLSDEFKTHGRILLGIVLDGEALAPEQLTSQLGLQSVVDINSLEVTSASLSELIHETLEEVAEVVVELPVVCREISEALIGDDPASCFGYFNQLLEVWEVLKERQAQVIVNLEFPSESILMGTDSIDDHNAQLDASIAKAKNLMESSSFQELSQLMTQDLMKKAECEAEWIDVLRSLVESD